MTRRWRSSAWGLLATAVALLPPGAAAARDDKLANAVLAIDTEGAQLVTELAPKSPAAR